MVAVPWQLVLISPLGIALTSLTTLFFVFLLMLMKGTPAMPFFMAKFGKKMILINPDEDKRMVFRVANKDSDMAYVKKKGYYIIDPNHVHIESISKIPVAITYGSYSESIDAKDAFLAEKLKGMGVKNYVELMDSLTDEITSKAALSSKLITQQQYDENPDRTYRVKKKNVGSIKINGESVGFDEIYNYFSKNTRADLIESKIQHRISAIKLEKLTQDKQIFKWAVILIIVLIGGALAYNMIRMGNPQQAATTAKNVGGIVGSGVNTITGGAINGTGLV
jgi:hypothetical protein